MFDKIHKGFISNFMRMILCIVVRRTAYSFFMSKIKSYTLGKVSSFQRIPPEGGITFVHSVLWLENQNTIYQAVIETSFSGLFSNVNITDINLF